MAVSSEIKIFHPAGKLIKSDCTVCFRFLAFLAVVHAVVGFSDIPAVTMLTAMRPSEARSMTMSIPSTQKATTRTSTASI